MALIGADGLDAFSMHKLAEALDLTVGAIYRYFPSKSALIAALEERVIDGLAAYLRAAETSIRQVEGLLDSRPLVLLLRIASVYHERFRSHPQQMRLLGGLLTSPDPILRPEEARSVMQSMMTALEVVSAAFAEAAERGALQPGDSLERAIVNWAALRGVEQTSKLGRHRPDLFVVGRLHRTVVDTLLIGWGARATDLESAWTYLKTENER